MPITLHTYDHRYLNGMAALYNAETGFDPFVATMTPELFHRLVAHKSYFDPHGLFVATEGEHVVGWVHACIVGGTEPWSDVSASFPRIRMLIFPKDRGDVGTLLVRTATE